MNGDFKMSPASIKTYRNQHIGDGQIHMMHIPSHSDVPHRHIFFELTYIVNGRANHYLNGTTVPLRTGDYFFVDIGTVHCYQDAEQLEIINCLFLPEYIDRALADCPSLSSLLTNQILRFGVPVSIHAADRTFHDTDGSVARTMKAMVREYNAQKTGYMELLRCQLTQVLVCAVRACEAAEQARTPHSATAAIVEYLHKHYTDPLSLDVCSQLVGYTPQYISNLFHRDTGMSIQEFLQRLRIEKACLLLIQKQLRMADIALSVGYSDVKHFSRVFRRHKGISPREYRNSITSA